MVADAGLVVDRGVTVVVVVHDGAGSRIHEEARQECAVRPNGLLTAPRGVHDGAMVGTHAVWCGDGGGVKSSMSGLKTVIPISHRVAWWERADATVQVAEQRLGRLLSQEFSIRAIGVKEEPLIVEFGSFVDLVCEGQDEWAITDWHGLSLVALGDIHQGIEDAIDEVAGEILVKERSHWDRSDANPRRAVGEDTHRLP
jgi:hypothetical protein